MDPSQGRSRLLAAVESLPLRYAPFWDRLAELWAIPVPEVEAVLTRAAARSSWRRAWPGFRYLDVPSGGDSRSRLLLFAPGFRFPAHRHEGTELVLVLQGSYRDSEGRRFSAGDVDRREAGSVHALEVDAEEPCMVAIRQPALSFTGPVLARIRRWLSP